MLLVFGWGFVVLGLIGLFLPILQGILFLVIGLSILSRESPFVRRQVAHLRDRYPKIARQMDLVQARANAVRERVTGWFIRGG